MTPVATLLHALVNPALLVWAREQSGYPRESVANRLNVKLERLLAWERGDLKPTVRQVQLLAKIYHRPFGVFFLPQPPLLAPMAAEYRRLPGVEPSAESPELRLETNPESLFFATSRARSPLFSMSAFAGNGLSGLVSSPAGHVRATKVALQLLQELGNPITEFETSAHLLKGPDKAGNRIRSLLGVTNEEQLGWKDEWEGWRRWREAAETAGILVFQFPKVSLNQVRGLSLLKFPLPVIGINTKESAPGARVFTLLHELTHIALSVGQEEKPALEETRDDTAWSKVERFAEKTASAALIPANVLASVLGRMSVTRYTWDIPLVRSLAVKFRVTPLAMATRLRVEGALTWDGYEGWKAGWAEYLKTMRPRSGGFASPIDKALGRGGRPLAQLVVEALDANRITAVEACRHLDLRFEHFDKLRTELRDRVRSTQTVDDGE